MKTIIKPDEGYRPKKNSAWCPYCGQETQFAWDSRVDVARCPECGVSARDYYTRTVNELSKDSALDHFERAAKMSGCKYTKPFFWEKSGSAEDTPADQKIEPETVRAGFSIDPPSESVELYCPNCGRYIKLVYAPVKDKCPTCGAAVVMDKDGSTTCTVTKDAVHCSNCSTILTENPWSGSAYYCTGCGIWSAMPGDKTGEKIVAKNSQHSNARQSLLPAPVLTKVRSLVASDCPNYQAEKHYCVFQTDKLCLFFGEQLHRCTVFEQSVLPTDQTLNELYWREYDLHKSSEDEHAKKIAKKARQEIKEVRVKNEKQCEVCGKGFMPEAGKEKSRYCSETCRRKAERDQVRERVQRIRAARALQNQGSASM